ncbi:MAG: hypothetical protein ABUR63_08510 [Verrucomicrobiota bacterium]
MKIIEIEDVIPKAYQDQVEAEMTSSQMAWFFHEETARSVSMFKTSFSGFSHMAYHARESNPVTSPVSSILLPILFMFCDKAGIKFNALLRIRLGLFTKTMIDAPHHNPHVDFYEPHHTAVYYVNDSDGDTFIFKETFDDLNLQQSAQHADDGEFTIAHRCPPKKGKMVGFDGKHYHASMHPMNANSRIAVTFNFR